MTAKSAFIVRIDPDTVRRLSELAERYDRQGPSTVAAEIVDYCVDLFDPLRHQPAGVGSNTEQLVIRINDEIVKRLKLVARKHDLPSGNAVARELIRQCHNVWEEAELAGRRVIEQYFSKHRKKTPASD